MEGLPKLPGPERDPFRIYGVNVILAHEGDNESPVIFETTPTYANLFGTIQRTYDARGGWSSDFMDLRGGSLLRADGGYLIMYSLETISEPGVWRALKRTLNHNRLEIQPADMFYPFGGSAMKPEPIQISVKVILIGDREMYELLYEYEEDFRKIFKVRVEFDEEMAMNDSVIAEYAGRLRALSEKEGLWPIDRAVCGHCGHRSRSELRSHRGGRIGSARRARSQGAAVQSGAAQSDRDAYPRNDRRGHAAGGRFRRTYRPGERVERAGDWWLCVRQAGADYRNGGTGQIGPDQH